MLDWQKSITKDDMPNEVLNEIASYDINAAVMLLDKFAGCTIYIPTDGFKALKIKHILKNFDGSTKSIRDLARATNLPEYSVRHILKKYRDVDLADGQIQLSIFKRTTNDI